jgi:hypothetical protein
VKSEVKTNIQSKFDVYERRNFRKSKDDFDFKYDNVEYYQSNQPSYKNQKAEKQYKII